MFKLYGVKWGLDVQLAIRQMEYVFQQQEPINEEFNNYMGCLNEAHNQLFQLLQDPDTDFPEMETNPIQSKEQMHGVPT